MKNLLLKSVIAIGLMLLIIPSLALSATFIQVKGSDTEVNVVQRLAENFMKKNPAYSLAVTGGGSGVGLRPSSIKRPIWPMPPGP